MAFDNEKQQLHLERDVMEVSLGATLLLTRNKIWFPRNEVPNSAVLWPMVLTKKSLTSMETSYSNIE